MVHYNLKLFVAATPLYPIDQRKQTIMSEEVLQPREPTPSPEPVSASKKFSDSFTANRKRLYINNVSYKATEDDIYDLLKDFEVYAT